MKLYMYDYVPDFEHCKKLFESGFSERTVFKWVYLHDNHWKLMQWKETNLASYPAPMLKEMIMYAHKGYDCTVAFQGPKLLDDKSDSSDFGYASFSGMPTGNYPKETYHAEFYSSTPENALADLIIWQLNSKI